jgi:hypothetical protein
METITRDTDRDFFMSPQVGAAGRGLHSCLRRASPVAHKQAAGTSCWQLHAVPFRSPSSVLLPKGRLRATVA